MMEQFNFWTNAKALNQSQDLVVLYVVNSSGSSPGRKGFRMLVSSKKTWGSIGGGIMEIKWVELARNTLQKKTQVAVKKRQQHSKNAQGNRSGLICSGEQTVVLIPLPKGHLNALLVEKGKVIFLSDRGISHQKNAWKEAAWKYEVHLQPKHTVYLIGGGHVGLAASKVLAMLDFHLVLIDNRSGLNTVEENTYVDKKIICDYAACGEHIQKGANSFVVIMSFGFATDKEILRSVMNKNVGFLGMMGSEEKIAQLKNELIQEGYDPKQWAHLHAPIGLPISSKTTEEIGISIAAQLIQIKNSAQPQ